MRTRKIRKHNFYLLRYMWNKYTLLGLVFLLIVFIITRELLLRAAIASSVVDAAYYEALWRCAIGKPYVYNINGNKLNGSIGVIKHINIIHKEKTRSLFPNSYMAELILFPYAQNYYSHLFMKNFNNTVINRLKQNDHKLSSSMDSQGSAPRSLGSDHLKSDSSSLKK